MAITENQLKISVEIDSAGAEKIIGTLSGSLKNFSNVAKNADKSTTGLESSFGKLKNSFKGVGASFIQINQALELAAKGMRALQAVAGQPFINASNLQKGAAEIRTLLSDAAKGTVDFEDAILSLQSKFGTDPTDAARAFYNAISSGAVGAQDSVELLNVAQKTAIGGVTDLNTAVSGITSVMSVYGDEAGSAAHISDVLFLSMRAGRTTIEELSNNLGKVLSTAKAAQISFEEITNATAITATAMGSTERATTSLRAAINVLLKPTEELKTVYENLGIKSIEATLAQDGLIKTFRRIAKEAGGSASQIATLLGSIEAQGAALALIGDTTGAALDALVADTQRSFEAIGQASDTAFQEMASQADFVAGVISGSMQASLTRIAKDILVTLLPALKSVADMLKFVASHSRDLADLAIAVAAVGTAAAGAKVATIAWAAATSGAMIPSLKAMATAGWAAVAPFLKFIAIGALIVAAIGAIEVAFRNFGTVMTWLELQLAKFKVSLLEMVTSMKKTKNEVLEFFGKTVEKDIDTSGIDEAKKKVEELKSVIDQAKFEGGVTGEVLMSMGRLVGLIDEDTTASEKLVEVQRKVTKATKETGTEVAAVTEKVARYTREIERQERALMEAQAFGNSLAVLVAERNILGLKRQQLEARSTIENVKKELRQLDKDIDNNTFKIRAFLRDATQGTTKTIGEMLADGLSIEEIDKKIRGALRVQLDEINAQITLAGKLPDSLDKRKLVDELKKQADKITGELQKLGDDTSKIYTEAAIYGASVLEETLKSGIPLAKKDLSALQAAARTNNFAFAQDNVDKIFARQEELIKKAISTVVKSTGDFPSLGIKRGDRIDPNTAEGETALYSLALNQIATEAVSKVKPVSDEVKNMVSELKPFVDEFSNKMGKNLSDSLRIESQKIDVLKAQLALTDRLDDTTKEILSSSQGTINARGKGLEAAESINQGVAGGIGKVMGQSADQITGAVSNFASRAQGLVSGMSTGIMGAAGMIMSAAEAIVAFIQKLIDFLPGIINAIANIFSSLTELPIKIVGAVQNLIRGLGKFITEFIPNLLDMAVQLAVEAVDFLTDELPDLVLKLVDTVPVLINRIIERLPDIVSKLTRALIAQTPTIIIHMIKYLIKGVPWIVTEFLKIIPELVYGIVKGVGDAFVQIFEAIFGGGGIKDAADKLGSGVSDAIKKGVGSSDQLFKVLDSEAQNLESSIGKRFSAEIRNTKGFWGKMWEELKEAGRWLDKEIFQPIGKGLEWFNTNVIVPATKIFRGLLEIFIAAVVTPLAAVAAAISVSFKLIKATFDFIFELFRDPKKAFANLGKALKEILQEVGDIFKPVTDLFESGLTKVIDGLFGDGKANKFYEWLKGGFDKFGEWLEGAPQKVEDWFTNLFKFDIDLPKMNKDSGVVEKFLGLEIPWMEFATGGVVPGKAFFNGDNPKNDTVPALLSPGEMVIPRSALTSQKALAEYLSMAGVPGFYSGTDLMNDLKNAGGSVVDVVSKIGGAIAGGTEEFLNDPLGSIKNLWDNVSSTAVRWTSDGFNFLTGDAAKIYNFLKSIGASIDFFNMLTNPVGEAKRALKTVSSKLIDPVIKDGIKGVLGFAQGGLVPGSGYGDTVPAMLTPGEFVLSRKAVAGIGVNNAQRINSGGGVGDTNQTFNFSIDIKTTEPVDDKMLKNRIIPEIEKHFKRKSNDGRRVLAAQGVR